MIECSCTLWFVLTFWKRSQTSSSWKAQSLLHCRSSQQFLLINYRNSWCGRQYLWIWAVNYVLHCIMNHTYLMPYGFTSLLRALCLYKWMRGYIYVFMVGVHGSESRAWGQWCEAAEICINAPIDPALLTALTSHQVAAIHQIADSSPADTVPSFSVPAEREAGIPCTVGIVSCCRAAQT